MTSIVPIPFLFRYRLPVRRIDRLPRTRSPLLKLTADCRVPWPMQLSGEPPLSVLSLAWNPQGLAVQVEVNGAATGGPIPAGASNTHQRAIVLWIDTRDTQSQHRASRFCHAFGAIIKGTKKAGLQVDLRQAQIARAREDAPVADVESLWGEAEEGTEGYRVSLWFPAEALHGFDPATQPRLGFYLTVLDSRWGQQPLIVADDFPYEADPSLWLSLDLLDA